MLFYTADHLTKKFPQNEFNLQLMKMLCSDCTVIMPTKSNRKVTRNATTLHFRTLNK